MKHGNRSTIFLAAIAMATTAGCAPTSAQESASQHPGDGAITTRVRAAIFSDPSLKSSEIAVETFEGRVRLSGIMNSLADIEKAAAVARGAGGVTAVDDGMRLEQKMPENDEGGMKANPNRVPPFLVWIAGIAIVTFWAAEIAAAMH